MGNVLLTRAMVRLVGVDGYAVVSVLISAFGWLLLLDFGIGLSLQNYLSEGSSDPRDQSKLRFTAGSILLLVGLISSAALLFSYKAIAALLFKNAEAIHIDTHELELSVLWGGLLGIIIGIGTAATKIWYSEHRGYLPIALGAVSTVVALAVASLLVALEHFPTTSLGVVIYFAPLAITMIYALLFKTTVLSRSWNWSGDWAIKLFSRGKQFWLFSIAAAFVLQLDNLILVHYVSPKELVTYNIAIRLIYAGLTFYSLALSLLHPIMTEGLKENNTDLVSKSLTQIILLGLFFCVAAAFSLVFLGDTVIRFIAPGMDHLTLSFITLMVVYLVIRVWSDAHGVVLMSASQIGHLVIPTLLQGGVSFALMLLLVPHYGIRGVLMAFIGSYILTNAWYAPYLCRQKIKVGFSLNLKRH